MFELLLKVEKHLQMDSWHLIMESVFERLYKIINHELLSRDNELEDFKEIFMFSLKSVYSLILDNKIKPVELVQRNFAVLHKLSKSQNKSVLDLLILNLNDDIVETIRISENPWIDQIWEELIMYLTKLFDDYFPTEVSSAADRKRGVAAAGEQEAARVLRRLRLPAVHQLPVHRLQVPLHRQPDEADSNHSALHIPHF